MNCFVLILVCLVEIIAVYGAAPIKYHNPKSNSPKAGPPENPFKPKPIPDTTSAYKMADSSLPAFRPAAQLPSPATEAGDSTTPPPPHQDSTAIATGSPSLAAPDSTPPPVKRKPYAGLQAGIFFSDFKQSVLFSADLDTINQRHKIEDEAKAEAQTSENPGLVYKANDSRILQPYDNVLYGFPIGLYAGMPVSRYFDLLASFQCYWKKQNAVIETRDLDILDTTSGNTTRKDPKNQSLKYFIQSNLIGAGAKFYLPENFITIKSGTSLYLSFLYFWNLANSELYSYAGSRDADHSIRGVGYEFNAGYQITTWRRFHIMGEISISKLKFRSSGVWGDVLKQRNGEKMVWEFSTLKFNFLFMFPIGRIPVIPSDSTSAIPVQK